MKSLYTSLAFISMLSAFGHAATLVSINVDTGARVLRNQSSVALTGGSTTVDFDGAVFQIGYYSTATTANNFGNGTFIALTGEGSFFNVPTTIGDSKDNGAGNGEIFSNRLDIFTGQNGGVNDGLLPSPGTPLSLLIYNNTNIALSSHYEAISNDLWLWATPANDPSQPIVNINFDDSGLVAKSGTNVASPGSNVNTNTPVVPEPTSAALLLVGLVSIAARRRREAK